MKSLTAKLLVINFIVMLTFAVFFLYETHSRTNKSITNIVNQQASLALEFDLSIRQYVAKYIRPTMYKLTGKEAFFPETMSTSYIARAIFDDVRKKFPDYIIKFSSDNPRNPLNQAGPEELKIIKMFNDHPKLKHWEGEITINGKKYLAKFSARRMVASCARCHGKPADAPASLVERYGDKNGFYRTLGDVVGLDTIAIPMTKVSEERKSVFLKASLLIGVGIILVFMVNFLIIRYLIIKRLSEISNHFFDVSREKDYGQIKPLKMIGKDEIGDLARSFNTMSERLKQSYALLDHKVNQRTSELQKEIVEHKKAEARLRQSEERFRLAFQTSPNIITLSSVEDGIYDDINDAFTMVVGYTKDEVIGKSSIELNIWDDVKDRETLVAGLQQNGVVQSLEAKFKRKDGKILDGIMSACILDIENKKFLLATTQDITPIKKAEKERLNLEIKLQQSHKMEAIGTLAGGIAHDFNNILSGIFGYTQLAQASMEEPEKAKELMNQVLTSAQRAAELVQQILTFSRQAEYKKMPMNMSHEVKESLKLLRASIPTSIEFSVALRSKSLISGDSTKIHQVLMNLCTNGYHSMMKTGGILTISLDDVKISESQKINDRIMLPGNYICLEVSDTGHGMDYETLKKATEPYFTTKGPNQGTGLGLALVKAIIDEHDGFLDIHSEIKKGTSIFIYLPTLSVKKISQETSPDTEVEALSGSERIMVVDDEKAIRDVSKAMLSRHGYKVSAFENGSTALDEFKKDPFKYDLVVSDMTMPKMSGDKLALEILKINPEIPVLLCTGFSETLSNEKASAIGIKKILDKPIAMNTLLKNIREILDQNESIF